MGDLPTWELGERLTIPRRKETVCYEMLHRDSELAGSFEYGNEPWGCIKGGEILE
jgi:hypothetical protein